MLGALAKAFVRLIGKALKGIGRKLTERGLEQGDQTPEVYIWHPYQTTACERICQPLVGVATVTVNPDGQMTSNMGRVPPGHPHCDCAMKSQKTGRFNFVSPYA